MNVAGRRYASHAECICPSRFPDSSHLALYTVQLHCTGWVFEQKQRNRTIANRHVVIKDCLWLFPKIDLNSFGAICALWRAVLWTVYKKNYNFKRCLYNKIVASSGMCTFLSADGEEVINSVLCIWEDRGGLSSQARAGQMGCGKVLGRF